VKHLKKAAIIMIGVMLVEGAPLASLAFQRGGVIYLAQLVGWGAGPVNPLGWALSLAIAVGYAALSMTSLPFIREHALRLAPIKLLALPFALITGLFEEWFFRRELMNVLAAHSTGLLLQIMVSGLGFGLAHAVWGLIGRQWRAAGLSIIYTGVLGALLATDYVISGRQLAPAAWSHILINLIIEPWLLLGVFALGDAPAANRRDRDTRHSAAA
jgi:hypothetical protein